MRHRRHRTAPAALLAAGLLLGCDITQEHVDQTSERLAEATVAVGSVPTQAAVDAGSTLQASHLAGSTWRLIEVSAWPDAVGVVTLGSNGRAVWHVDRSIYNLSAAGHWEVTAGVFSMGDQRSFSAGSLDRCGVAGIRVDANTGCLLGGSECGYVFQRVTP